MIGCLVGKDAPNAVVKWSAKLNSGSGSGLASKYDRVIPHDAPPRIIVFM